MLDLPPTQDSSHHQEYETSLVGNPEPNLYLSLENPGWRADSSYMFSNSSFIQQSVGCE